MGKKCPRQTPLVFGGGYAGVRKEVPRVNKGWCVIEFAFLNLTKFGSKKRTQEVLVKRDSTPKFTQLQSHLECNFIPSEMAYNAISPICTLRTQMMRAQDALHQGQNVTKSHSRCDCTCVQSECRVRGYTATLRTARTQSVSDLS